MRPESVSTVVFGYSSPLKRAWDKGALPNVTHGLSGQKLTKENRTVDHLLPHSKGGRTTLDNLVLETREFNQDRGCTPIEKLVTIEMLRKYLKQFEGQYNKYFDIDAYVQGIRRFFKNIVDME